MTEAIVETTAGKLRGSMRDDIHIFRGIPYAGPVSGQQRFRPPTKPQAWAGVRDALAYGPSCPQPTGGMDRIRGLMGSTQREPEGEDCLYLNIWTPGLNDSRKRPVMFWCHGGGFTMGSGSAGYYRGNNLARRGDVVIVTVNHRLGPLGYLYLDELAGEEFAGSGNAGMLDLVAALEWVHDNIATFGGDPGNVTIFGESGGGAKVSMLLAMPDAAGLFHRAIIQSGPGIRMTPPQQATENAQRLLKALDISSKDAGRLQNLPVEQIIAANARINPNPLSGWRPVVDGRVLPNHPFDPVAPALSADVPIIIGTNKDEATLFLLGEDLSTLDDAGLLRRARGFVGDAAESLIATYRHVYPQASPGDIFAAAMGDHMMRMNSLRIAERKAAQGAAPAYMYYFTWETPILNGRLKSCHALEIPFVFDNLIVAGPFTGEDPNRLPLASKMSEAWMTFARTGVPEAAELPSWPTYSPTERATMIFDATCWVEDDPDKELREAWEHIVIPSLGG